MSVDSRSVAGVVVAIVGLGLLGSMGLARSSEACIAERRCEGDGS